MTFPAWNRFCMTSKARKMASRENIISYCHVCHKYFLFVLKEFLMKRRMNFVNICSVTHWTRLRNGVFSLFYVNQDDIRLVSNPKRLEVWLSKSSTKKLIFCFIFPSTFHTKQNFIAEGWEWHKSKNLSFLIDWCNI